MEVLRKAVCSELVGSPALLAQPSFLFSAGGVCTDHLSLERSIPSEEQRWGALNPTLGSEFISIKFLDGFLALLQHWPSSAKL